MSGSVFAVTFKFNLNFSDGILFYLVLRVQPGIVDVRFFELCPHDLALGVVGRLVVRLHLVDEACKTANKSYNITGSKASSSLCLDHYEALQLKKELTN